MRGGAHTGHYAHVKIVVTFNGETIGLILGTPLTHKLHILPALSVFSPLAQRHIPLQVTLGIGVSAIRARAERILAELADPELIALAHETGPRTHSAATVARLAPVQPVSSSTPPCFG